ncbi:MAG: hypothetical protein BZ136_05855 [Methanosphaera sp. rholeuAM74]|nr:MAG: hypothetical protein BZ136_05855 [Methanosphaera sp. rholeuAM74]
MIDKQEEILQKHHIIVHTYEDNTIEDIPQLLGQINQITLEQEDSTIQLLDTNYICGSKHLKQAMAMAFKAFSEKQNFANDKGLEICVRLSAQKQITKAIKLLGIKEKGNITVVYVDTNDEQIRKVAALLDNRNDQLLEEYDADRIIKAYHLDESLDILGQLNENIALLSLKS